MLTWNEIRARCAAFSERWKDATDEDADAKSFWDELFTCFGANRRQVASFEAPIRMLNGNLGYIDLLWKGTMLAEHKSRGKDLEAARRQGLDYIERLKAHERPRWLVTSDFARIVIHDLHGGGSVLIGLSELAARAEALGFLAGYEPKRPTEAFFKGTDTLHSDTLHYDFPERRENVPLFQIAGVQTDGVDMVCPQIAGLDPAVLDGEFTERGRHGGAVFVSGTRIMTEGCRFQHLPPSEFQRQHGNGP